MISYNRNVTIKSNYKSICMKMWTEISLTIPRLLPGECNGNCSTIEKGMIPREKMRKVTRYNVYLSETWSSRKSTLEIRQIYLNLACSALNKSK